MDLLNGKVVLITGGGTGIGRATALLFAREGADVAVNYSRSEKDAEATADDVRKLGRTCIAVKADVSDETAVRAMVARVVRDLGGVDTLVNSAGTTRFVPLSDVDGITEEDWDRLMGVNVKGAFYASRAVLPSMKQRGRGHIVNIASIAGMTGKGSSLVYSASKAAMICMTRSLAVGLAPAVRVNAIAPGFVETRWGEGWEEFRKVHRDNTPMKRNARAEDIAEAVLGLEVSGFVTGQALVVDGGRSL